ncbi:hypothetical protein AMECASPLE_038993 [Ameca splendens]|uniref:Uncharacterized protein n=1 Tax=Ameca splendens TaxID=208324 RepID=A0ABV0ZU63_9TELE
MMHDCGEEFSKWLGAAVYQRCQCLTLTRAREGLWAPLNWQPGWSQRMVCCLHPRVWHFHLDPELVLVAVNEQGHPVQQVLATKKRLCVQCAHIDGKHQSHVFECDVKLHPTSDARLVLGVLVILTSQAPA